MNDDFRIEENELIDQKHYPVKVLFDMVSDDRLKKVILGICNNIGFGENYGACIFWDDLDDYDKTNIKYYEGAEFGLNNGEEVIISYKELFYYLKIVCKKYCKNHPSDKKEIEQWLKNYQYKYDLNDTSQFSEGGRSRESNRGL